MRFILVIYFSLFVFGLANAQTDTLNQTDVNGKKQGYWKIYGKDKPGSGYADTSLIEDGNYKDNRKNGLWKKYHPNGQLKLEGNYINNRPNGQYKKYYEIGVLQERATWKQNKYIDSFFRYYENKQLQQSKFFNENGKEEGWSIYFLENGEIELKAYYINGVAVPDSTYKRNYKSPGIKSIEIDPKPEPVIKGKYIEYDGEFRDGKLWNGKHYIYDKDGILLKIEIYKNGKYFGYAQSDTLNRVGADGKKTGYWIFFGKDKPNQGFLETDKVEEGKYDAGRKNGLWKTYYPGNKIKSEIEYKNNRPNGKFKTYYDNGQLEEEGTWRGTSYIDTLRRYDSIGNLVLEKVIDQKAKTGHKSIYPTLYEPELIYSKPLNHLCECEIVISDTIYIYYDIDYKVVIHGEFKDNRIYNGRCRIYQSDSLLIKSFKYHKGKMFIEVQKEKLKTSSKNQQNSLGDDKNNIPDGYHKIYNENNQIFQDGEFKDGKLFNGKKYIYDKNGLLEKIEIYKNGKYAGDAQIDD